ncbi:hypothetical protein QTG54_002448 [Skeletonema marinoi]|uniref:Uncharacterized protein n=1 Tax=Skeletonema marinoi TaxID=267567 RepID=A0AAD9DI95_9STRA|nr:hypothetical protein QTG54_002448 [Skeletonema marinoi]
MLERGWLHLNRALINDPRVLQRATSTSAASANASFVDINALGLNVSEGTAGMVAMDYSQQLERNTRLQEARNQRRQEAASAHSTLEHIQGQRLSGGLLFSHGHVALDQDVLDLLESRRQLKTDEKYQSLKKKAIALQKILNAHETLLSNRPHGEPVTNPELKAWIGVRWKKGDKTIPSTKTPLLTMKNDMATRHAMSELKELLVARKHCSSDEEADEFLSQFYEDLEAQAEADEDGSDEDAEGEEEGESSDAIVEVLGV